MKVGILGSGDVAQSLGSGFVATGHTVRLGSRTPNSPALEAWKSRVGSAGSSGTFASAAEFGELLVLSTHGVNNGSAIDLAGPAHFAGKVLIDTTNPLVTDAQGRFRLAIGHTDSAGEQVQRAVPAARVVKAFNIVGHAHMFRPEFVGGPPDMFYCGNEGKAKQEVADLLRSFGWNPIDVGDIDASRMLESLCLLWLTAARSVGSWDVAFRLLRKR